MDFEQVLAEIRDFWVGEPLPFQGGGDAEVSRVQSLFTQKFPHELQQYIGAVLPPTSLHFESVGNPLHIWGFTGLSADQSWYRENSITGDWSPGWLVIAEVNEGPVIVDLNSIQENTVHCPVLWRIAWMDWDFDPIADTLPQFLLLAAYQHHALTAFGEVIIDDEHSFFRLADPAAEWLFPRVKHCAPEYYDWWLGVFDNA